MVLLTMTPSIVEALNQLSKTNIGDVAKSHEGNSNMNDNVEPSLEDPSIGKPISHGQIIDIWTTLKASEGGDKIKLEELLRGATVYIPPPPPKPEQVRHRFLYVA